MPDELLSLDAPTTALVVIDLQRGVAGLTVAPHTASDVIACSSRLADRFRELGSLVVLVRVSSVDGKDRLQQSVDAPPMSSGAFPEGFDIIVDDLGPKPGDLVITKHQWGEFYGTELDLQLRRHGIDTIVLCGIATNMGVESTARDAYEHGYSLILVEDAMSSLTAQMHRFAIESIFPRLGRVQTTESVLAALK